MAYYMHVPELTTLSPWDMVRPRYWYPSMNLEQSLLDLELLEMTQALLPLLALNLLDAPTTDDDFFADLPVGANTATELPATGAAACSNYSYSHASVVDDQGKRVTSVRRRYEDSSGRLKAVHEREVDGKRLVTKWTKKDKDDKGEHLTLCSEGVDKAGFEALWAETPFHKAHTKNAEDKVIADSAASDQKEFSATTTA
ncbi:hypothetical protein ACHHYP_11587 [Achlya hypogyna]|uniref:Uncharacterized protein n=1 Tax=Achlya hypogyna TaxID=1202772 RepID=A0A1V9YIW1_ACHHY|nr:hypothetical protein ACHHYP_11587 [Achlya hypogyna]